MSEECIECGEEIPEDDAVYGQGSVKEDGVEDLGDGESVGVDEVFAFDDGPYCGFDCLMAGDGDA